MRISPPKAKRKTKLAAVRDRMALSSLSPSDDHGDHNSSDLGAVESIDLGAEPNYSAGGSSASSNTGSRGAPISDRASTPSSVRDNAGSGQGPDEGPDSTDTGRANRARGSSRGAGDTRRTGSDSGSEGAEAGEGSPSSAIPRSIDYATLGGPSGKKSHVLSVEFLAEGWCILFQTIGFVVNDKEWELDKDTDGAELAERTISWFQSLDKKRAGEWEKRIAKWQPLLAVFTALATLVIPRILATRSKRRAVHVQAPGGHTTNRTAAPTAETQAGVTAAGAPIIDPSLQASRTAGNGQANGAGKPTGNGPNSVRFRPVRHQDWGELFGPDV